MSKKIIDKKRARLLYLLGFNSRQISKVMDKSRGWVDKRVRDVPKDERICFHLQENVDLNSLYDEYIK